jgi:hypothetical protein
VTTDYTVDTLTQQVLQTIVCSILINRELGQDIVRHIITVSTGLLFMSIIRMLGISIFILVSANCGSRSVGTPVATPLPSATIKSGTDATATDQSQTSATAQITIMTEPTVIANTDDLLASGLTPKGYHVLGNMAAPITFVDYSDILLK